MPGGTRAPDHDRQVDRAVALALGYTERAFTITIITAGIALPEQHSVWRTPAGALAPRGEVPAFSAEIAAAWTVVEHMRALGYFVRLDIGPFLTCMVEDFDRMQQFYGKAETMPAAICLSCVGALGAPGGEDG